MAMVQRARTSTEKQKYNAIVNSLVQRLKLRVDEDRLEANYHLQVNNLTIICDHLMGILNKRDQKQLCKSVADQIGISQEGSFHEFIQKIVLV